jgi:hypothetical protein
MNNNKVYISDINEELDLIIVNTYVIEDKLIVNNKQVVRKENYL